MVLQDWMQYLQGLPADVGAIPLLLCATKPDLPGKGSSPVVCITYLWYIPSQYSRHVLRHGFMQHAYVVHMVSTTWQKCNVLSCSMAEM